MKATKMPVPENFTSRYEYSKATSNYHFDPMVDDDANPPFKKIGRFIGAWSDEIIEMAADVRPNTYHNRMISKVPYLDTLETNDLVKMGLGVNHVLHDKSTKPLTVTFKRMASFFSFDRSKPMHATFHVQKPGQVFVKHIDSCSAARGNKSSDDANLYFEQPELIARFIIALEDWQLGHMWAYGNTYWKQWRAGDIVFHSWVDIPHATANASHEPRYSIQVTGYTTERTVEIINTNEFMNINI